jgi:hypothetical protein
VPLRGSRFGKSCYQQGNRHDECCHTQQRPSIRTGYGTWHRRWSGQGRTPTGETAGTSKPGAGRARSCVRFHWTSLRPRTAPTTWSCSRSPRGCQTGRTHRGFCRLIWLPCIGRPGPARTRCPAGVARHRGAHRDLDGFRGRVAVQDLCDGDRPERPARSNWPSTGAQHRRGGLLRRGVRLRDHARSSIALRGTGMARTDGRASRAVRTTARDRVDQVSKRFGSRARARCSP